MVSFVNTTETGTAGFGLCISSSFNLLQIITFHIYHFISFHGDTAEEISPGMHDLRQCHLGFRPKRGHLAFIDMVRLGKVCFSQHCLKINMQFVTN